MNLHAHAGDNLLITTPTGSYVTKVTGVSRGGYTCEDGRTYNIFGGSQARERRTSISAVASTLTDAQLEAIQGSNVLDTRKMTAFMYLANNLSDFVDGLSNQDLTKLETLITGTRSKKKVKNAVSVKDTVEMTFR